MLPLVLLLHGLALPAPAQPTLSPPPEPMLELVPAGEEERAAVVKRIDRLRKRLDRRREEPGIKIVRLYRAGDRRGEFSGWRRGPYAKVKDKVMTADLHFMDGRLRIVESWDSTGLGGWERRVAHYFREDGTLAFLHSEIFYLRGGDHKVVERVYYDQGGVLLRQERTFLDLRTGARIHERPYKREEPEVFLTVDDYFKSLRPLVLREAAAKGPPPSEAGAVLLSPEGAAR